MSTKVTRCVVFDLDDTLFDERQYVQSGFRAVARMLSSDFGISCEHELLALDTSGQRASAFQELLRRYALPADTIDAMLATYRTHVPEIALRVGMRELLERLQVRGDALACITDGRSVAQRAKLAALRVDSLFAAIAISEETGHAKPDPFNFALVMSLVPAVSYVYVGDNGGKDFIAPRALGWSTLGVRSDRNLRAFPVGLPSAPHDPDRWVDEADVAAVLLGQPPFEGCP